MEIQPDGSVVTWSGPTQFLSTGSRPLSPPHTPRLGTSPPRYAAPSADLAREIAAAAARRQVSPELVEAVAWRESGFNPAAISPKGARGVMQLMPATARALGVDPDDQGANIDGGAAYLSRMIQRFGGDVARGLAAYNAGPRAVDRYGGVPPYAETVAYVNAIQDRLSRSAGR